MIDVQTQAEHDAEYARWRDTWRRWCWRGRRQNPEPSLYPRETCADARPTLAQTAAERLAIYNRQYWFRLFGVRLFVIGIVSWTQIK